MLKRFNIGDQNPLEAVGEVITVDGQKMEIIGVVRDFQYGKSIDKEIEEFMFRYSPKSEYINAKVLSSDWPANVLKN